VWTGLDSRSVASEINEALAVVYGFRLSSSVGGDRYLMVFQISMVTDNATVRGKGAPGEVTS
jgi:hypothetical protein